MQRYKKELCRNFQRGFCQYGERCRFVHEQESSRPGSNSFTFGNNGQPPGLKTFENKWSRFSSNNTPSQLTQRGSDSKPQAITNHDCGDRESCKKIIADDFQNERPLWKLTCYGHWKGFPCDINGDISSEELRAAAYDDTRRGLGIHSIVERERNLLNSKLLELENFSRTMGKALGTDQPFPVSLNMAPPTVSSFSQLGASLNLGAGKSHVPNFYDVQQPRAPTPNGFEHLNRAFGPGSFGSVLQRQEPNVGRFLNSGTVSTGSNTWARSPQISTNMGGLQRSNELLDDADVSAFASLPVQNAGVQSVNKTTDAFSAGDASIWKKMKWAVGEIPEEAPPDAVIVD